MNIYIPEHIIIRKGYNSIHCQSQEKALQMFIPFETQFIWDGQRNLIKAQLPLVQTLFKKIIRDLQYPTLISLRLEGLTSRFEPIDNNRILFKIGHSHAYYLRVPQTWRIKYLTSRVCWFTGPNSVEVPLLVETIKRFKKLDRYRNKGFISSKVSLPRINKSKKHK